MNESDIAPKTQAAISGLQQRIQQAEQAASGAETQHLQQRSADLAPIEQNMQQQLQAPLPERQRAEMPEYKPQPVIDGKDFQNYAMGLLAFGLIGGIAAKDRWGTVASALNGSMEGYLQGNQMLAEQRYNDYKTAFEAAKAKETQANKEFESLLNRRDISLREMQMQYKILAAKWDRVDAQDAVRRKDIGAMYKSLEHYQTSLDKLQAQHDMMQERFAFQKQMAQERQAAQSTEKGWQIMTDTEGRFGPKGGLVRINAQTNDITPFNQQTTGLTKLSSPSQRISVNLEQAKAIVRTDIAEIDYGLDEIAKLRSKTTSPFFMQEGEGHLSAFHRFTQNKLTPSEQQQYDAYANRIATAIAGAQTQGKNRPTEAARQEAKRLLPTPGDTQATIDAKLKTIKRLRDIAHEVLQQQGKPESAETQPAKQSEGHIDLPARFIVDKY